MNKDQVKGFIKADAGETQKDFGRLVGSETQEAKGLAREIEGRAQKNLGDAKEAIEDAADDAEDAAEDARKAAR